MIVVILTEPNKKQKFTMSQSIITRSRNIYTSGAEREKTCNQLKGREKAGKASHVGFGLVPDWLRTQHAFCDWLVN